MGNKPPAVRAEHDPSSVVGAHRRLPQFAAVALATSVLALGAAESNRADAASLDSMTDSGAVPAPFAQKESKACSPRRQINLTLKERPSSNSEREQFTLRAERCRKYAPKVISTVRLSESGVGKAQKWQVQRFAWGDTEFRRFAVSTPRGKDDDFSGQKTIQLKATTREGTVLGRNRYRLRYHNGRLVSFQEASIKQDKDDTSAGGASTGTKLPKKSDCADPDFYVGFTDYNSVWQRDIDRKTVFDVAERELGATAIRIMITPGEVKRNGLQPVSETIMYAASRGMKVLLNAYPDPTYADQDHTSELSASNPDPAKMYEFTRMLASSLPVNHITYWSVGNEPSHPYFNASQNMEIARRTIMAGEAGLDAALDPDPAKLRGELAPLSISTWLPFIGSLPAGNNQKGIATHSYASLIDNTAEYVRKYGPLYITEAGHKASDPNQASNNKRAYTIACRDGAKAIYYYQVIGLPGYAWNTGIVQLASAAEPSSELPPKTDP